VEVLHNGQPSPYHTEWQGRFFRILIGDADVFIPRGEHTYTIRYVTTRQLRFFEGYRRTLLERDRQFLELPHPRRRKPASHLPDGARAIKGSGDQPIPGRLARPVATIPVPSSAEVPKSVSP
jgi:hypothetical protein